jgi:hypothetical protein
VAARVCQVCGAEAVGRCRDCRQLYCRAHGRVLCQRCRRSHRLPMALLAAFGTFPTATCALVGLLYKGLSLDIFGPVGVAILVAAALLTAGAISVVWRHPEGIAHAERFD